MTTTTTREYRCTRDAPYTAPTCEGHTDRKCRQGHYVQAASATEALQTMARDFPADVADGHGFTAHRWIGCSEVSAVEEAALDSPALPRPPHAPESCAACRAGVCQG